MILLINARYETRSTISNVHSMHTALRSIIIFPHQTKANQVLQKHRGQTSGVIVNAIADITIAGFALALNGSRLCKNDSVTTHELGILPRSQCKRTDKTHGLSYDVDKCANKRGSVDRKISRAHGRQA